MNCDKLVKCLHLFIEQTKTLITGLFSVFCWTKIEWLFIWTVTSSTSSLFRKEKENVNPKIKADYPNMICPFRKESRKKKKKLSRQHRLVKIPILKSKTDSWKKISFC